MYGAKERRIIIMQDSDEVSFSGSIWSVLMEFVWNLVYEDF